MSNDEFIRKGRRPDTSFIGSMVVEEESNFLFMLNFLLSLWRKILATIHRRGSVIEDIQFLGEHIVFFKLAFCFYIFDDSEGESILSGHANSSLLRRLWLIWLCLRLHINYVDVRNIIGIRNLFINLFRNWSTIGSNR
jgi:hypothetical protein